MATINPVIEDKSGRAGEQYIVLLWETVTNADTAASIKVPDWVNRVSDGDKKTDLLVQVDGTFDSAVVTVEQSIDNTNWYTAQDADGADTTFSAAGKNSLRDDFLYLRFSHASGLGTQDLDIRLQISVAKY